MSCGGVEGGLGCEWSNVPESVHGSAWEPLERTGGMKSWTCMLKSEGGKNWDVK